MRASDAGKVLDVEDWVLIAGLIVALFFAATLIKTVMGWAVRYVIFVAMAGLIYRAQIGGELDFADTQALTAIATIGALALVATLGIMALLFRNSRFKTILFPLIGFGTTFAAAAMVAYGS